MKPNIKISTPAVSENLVNGNSRLLELIGARKSNGAAPAVNRSQPTGTKSAVAPVDIDSKLGIPAALAAVCTGGNDADYEQDNDDTDGIRERFIAALTVHCKAESTLSVIVAEMIQLGIDRDTAIEWGIDAGLSDGYVRSTVSRLFIALVGRVKRKGQGRKVSPNAVKLAKLVLRWKKGSFKQAKAILLAARRIVESLEREADKE